MSDISIRYQTGAPQNLEKRFAGRAAGMLPSEIRSLFAVASLPEIGWLAGLSTNLF